MGVRKGIYGSVYIASNRVAEVREWSYAEQAAEITATTMNDGGNESFEAGPIDTSVNVNCYYDDTDTNGQAALVVGSTVTLNLYPMVNGSGAKFKTGSAKVMSKSEGATVGDLVTTDFTFKINGGLTEDTVA